MRIRTLLGTMCLFIALAACEDSSDNYLEGSVTDAYAMGFDSVRVRLYPDSALSVEYIKNDGGGEVMPVRVTIDLPVADITTGVAYDATTQGTITRGVGYDTSPLPPVDSGEIELFAFEAVDGETVSGEFHGLFTSSTGSQMNLRGGFSAPLEVVN